MTSTSSDLPRQGEVEAALSADPATAAGQTRRRTAAMAAVARLDQCVSEAPAANSRAARLGLLSGLLDGDGLTALGLAWLDHEGTVSALLGRLGAVDGLAVHAVRIEQQIRRTGREIRAADRRAASTRAEARSVQQGEEAGPEQRVLDALSRRALLERGEVVGYGGPRRSLRNCALILSMDSRWRRRLRWNEFTTTIELDGVAIEDHQLSSAIVWLDRCYGLEWSADVMGRALEMAARTRAYHPVREYLSALAWDGTARISSLLPTYFGVEPSPDTKLIEHLGRCFAISCVARVFSPGSKVDTTLILHGPQGVMKSTAFRILAVKPEWFSDTIIDIRNKDALMALPGIWIYELAELDSIRRADVTTLRAFLSSQADRLRWSYARFFTRLDRQTVFVGTANELQFLVDPSGNRRMWPVTVGRIDLDALRRDRDQLWAEAVEAYRAGEHWWLDRAESEEMSDHSQQYEHEDPWSTPLREWIRSRTSAFMISQALEDGLDIEPGKQSRADAMRAAAVVSALGWKRRREQRAGVRVWLWCRPESRYE